MMNNPELYSQNNATSREATEILLQEYRTKINWKKYGESAIDIGSADGSVTSLVKQYIPSKDVKLVGCDISEVMVKYANEKHNSDNITFRVLDITAELPDELKNGFNHAFSFFTLNRVQNQEKAFENIYNLLTNGGDCLLAFIQYIPIYDLFTHAAQNSKWGSTWLKNLDNFISPYYKIQEPEKKITEMMLEIGFVDVDVRSKTNSYPMKNGKELKDLMRTVQPNSIPTDVFEEIAMECVPLAQEIGLLDAEDKTFDDRDSPIDYEITLLVVYGRKP